MLATIKTLSVARVCAGVATMTAPQFTGRIAGIGGAPDAQLAARLFGAREIAVGLSTLRADRASAKSLIKLGVCCDVLDVVAAVACHRAGSTTRPNVITTAAAGVAAALVGLSTLRQAEHDDAWR